MSTANLCGIVNYDLSSINMTQEVIFEHVRPQEACLNDFILHIITGLVYANYSKSFVTENSFSSNETKTRTSTTTVDPQHLKVKDTE